MHAPCAALRCVLYISKSNISRHLPLPLLLLPSLSPGFSFCFAFSFRYPATQLKSIHSPPMSWLRHAVSQMRKSWKTTVSAPSLKPKPMPQPLVRFESNQSRTHTPSHILETTAFFFLFFLFLPSLVVISYYLSIFHFFLSLWFCCNSNYCFGCCWWWENVTWSFLLSSCRWVLWYIEYISFSFRALFFCAFFLFFFLFF